MTRPFGKYPADYPFGQDGTDQNPNGFDGWPADHPDNPNPGVAGDGGKGYNNPNGPGGNGGKGGDGPASGGPGGKGGNGGSGTNGDGGRGGDGGKGTGGNAGGLGGDGGKGGDGTESRINGFKGGDAGKGGASDSGAGGLGGRGANGGKARDSGNGGDGGAGGPGGDSDTGAAGKGGSGGDGGLATGSGQGGNGGTGGDGGNVTSTDPNNGANGGKGGDGGKGGTSTDGRGGNGGDGGDGGMGGRRGKGGTGGRPGDGGYGDWNWSNGANGQPGQDGPNPPAPTSSGPSDRDFLLELLKIFVPFLSRLTPSSAAASTDDSRAFTTLRVGHVSIPFQPIDIQAASSAQIQILGDILRLARVGRKNEAVQLSPATEELYPETPAERVPTGESLARIEGIDQTLGSRLVSAGIWTLSDLADPARVASAGKIEGISEDAMRTFHEAARVALRYPALTPNEIELAVKGFDLKVPVDRERAVKLLSASDHEIRTAFGRVRLPRNFGVATARTMLKKLVEA